MMVKMFSRLYLALWVPFFLAPAVASAVLRPSMPKTSASPTIQITRAEAKQLDVAFKKTLNVELKGLEHRLRGEVKELKTSQAAALKEWEKQETEARRKFFAEHSKGSEKRVYIQDFLARRKAFQAKQKEEFFTKTKVSEDLLRALRTDQAKRSSDFRNALSRGERPDSSVWKSGVLGVGALEVK